jgi:hypothetical protein
MDDAEWAAAIITGLIVYLLLAAAVGRLLRNRDNHPGGA